MLKVSLLKDTISIRQANTLLITQIMMTAQSNMQDPHHCKNKVAVAATIGLSVRYRQNPFSSFYLSNIGS